MHADSLSNSESTAAHGEITPSNYSFWLDYARLLGIPSGVGVLIATPLHGLGCELRDEPTHWGTAVFLMFMGGCLAWCLWSAYRWSQRYFLMSALGISLVLVASPFIAEFCEAHQLFLAVLLLATLAASITAWFRSKETSPLAPLAAEANQPDEPDETAECAPQTVMPPSTEQTEAEELPVHAASLWRKYAVALVLLAGVFIYMVVVPTVSMLLESLQQPTGFSREQTDMTLSEQIRLHSVSGIVMLIFLATGASVGSFLNVVIYRLPRRRPLLWPPSACPNCEQRIAGRDNIPILGWLSLGGRCRNCSISIPMRYPLIESLVAAVFVLFYYVELISGGENLPVRQPNAYNGIVWILLYTKWDLLTLYAFHMIVLVTLLGWGMINLDRFRVPTYAWVAATLTAVLLLTMFPHLNPLTAARTFPGDLLPTGGQATGLLIAVAGAISGVLVGYGLDRLFRLGEVAACTAEAPSEADDATVDQALIEQIGSIANEREDQWRDDSPELVGPPLPAAGSPEPLQGWPVTQAELYTVPASQPATVGNAMAALTLVGATFGFQAAFIVGCLAAAGTLLIRLAQQSGFRLALPPSRSLMPASLMVFWITVFMLAGWGTIHDWFNHDFTASELL